MQIPPLIGIGFLYAKEGHPPRRFRSSERGTTLGMEALKAENAISTDTGGQGNPLL